MSVRFTGFAGLQTDSQHTLLVNQDTWCVSFFFQLEPGSSTDSELMNQIMLLTCQPTYPQATTAHNLTLNQDVSVTPSPDVVMRIALMKAFDPSLVGFSASVRAGNEWATFMHSGVDAFGAHSGHHICLYGIPRVDPGDGSDWSQGLYLFVDAVPADLLDQDLGTNHNDWFATGGPCAIDPYFPADTTKNPDFAVRLGNPNMIQLWPGQWFGSAYYPGEVSYFLKDVAIWHGWAPQPTDIVALRDKTKRPGDFASGLQVWWPLDGTSGDVSGSDTDLQNAAAGGAHDLNIV